MSFTQIIATRECGDCVFNEPAGYCDGLLGIIGTCIACDTYQPVERAE